MAEQITLKHLGVVMDYVTKHGSISNRECREMTELSYDSSIKIFAGLCTLGMLRKTGESSSTKYVLGNRQQSERPRLPGYHRKTLI